MAAPRRSSPAGRRNQQGALVAATVASDTVMAIAVSVTVVVAVMRTRRGRCESHSDSEGGACIVSYQVVPA
jgi:hypothetical protein